MRASTPPAAAPGSPPFAILRIFLRLGCTAFGGPIAHLGYFRAEFVERRQWLTEQAYADLVALSQFLPGPASSQTGFGIGLIRGGLAGGIAAWIGFTLPSAALLVAFSYGAGTIAATASGAGLLHGLKLATVAIVAQAVMGMARSLCPDRTRATIATAAMVTMLLAPGALFQFGTILAGGIAGRLLCQGPRPMPPDTLRLPQSRRAAIGCLVLFLGLLAFAFIPMPPGPVALFDAFYRSGALVFGGGHVVLPLLREAVVTPGWVSDSAFLAGYGATQAVPGPLFTFAAYLGAIAGMPPGGVAGALIALCAIFLPGILCLLGALPFWHDLRGRPGTQAAMRGTNAAVVGLLAAALYDPVWTSAVHGSADCAVVAMGVVLLVAWRAPPLPVVLLSALAGLLLPIPA
ncbi:chromate efflux transporter [Gluconacetobacter takamatsuzukensis]|uniref:Chromate efflux transporter n=1 Tax=Gluconacetobacter takamatsuzukensis TaxID=1286190 RepID=A0A7W4PNH6_9PROT|nr:chromate efflux transporter [Gluconacetobacter takamatsuzukensis]MBB2204562.1 chromate efflux transporter [Gluconacetobacter takamatsuzukensis]